MKLNRIYPAGAAVLAPLAGHTDLPMRLSARRHGCRYAFTEMIDAGSLVFGNAKTMTLIRRDPAEDFLGVQLVGSDHDTLKKAVEILNGLDFSVLDFNLGCPAPKVAKKGEGASFALQRPDEAIRAFSILTKYAKMPVTAKIRLGQGEDTLNFREVIAELESAGVDAITVHARTRKQRYAGTPRYDLMKDLRGEMSVPLIVSGNIFSLDDAIGYTGITGADAVMVARGGVGNPFLVTQIDRWFRDGSRLPNPTMSQQVDWCKELADLMYAEKGDEVASKKMRSIAPKFVVGCRKSREFRYRLATEIDTREDLDRILEEVRERLGDRVVLNY